MPRELKLEWREIPLARRGKDSRPQQLCAREGQQLLKAVPAGDRVIVLDVRGKRISTEQLAQQLESWQMSGDNYSLLIGGPDGLSSDCLERAEQRWSLSDLTLPHPLVRVLLAEQLYRAWTITVNHPYHRQ
jgi:23S rRNA (pseudouridine1915-N3)-methyltransferase